VSAITDEPLLAAHPRPDDDAAWRTLIGERSPLGPARTETIAKGFFASSMPRRLRYGLDHHDLGIKAVLDVGCGYGQGLRFFGRGSMGIDNEQEAVAFAQALGFDAHCAAIDDPDLADLIPNERFEAVWCCDVLEHVTAPHTALIQLRRVLQTGGKLFIRVPIIPRSLILGAAQRVALRAFYGWGPHYGLPYEAADHVNAFTPQTLAFMLQRSGFDVVGRETTLTTLPLARQAANTLLRNSANTMMLIAQRRDSWGYHPTKSRRTLSERGWKYTETRPNDP
jgi:SAM-dependent methyltransferase